MENVKKNSKIIMERGEGRRRKFQTKKAL